mgnify:CR=1 FL=1
MGYGSQTAISTPDLIDLRGEIAYVLCTWLVNCSFVPIAWRPPSLVFGIGLAGLLEDPTVSVGMISWFIGVAVNLAGSVQYPA